MKLSTEKEYQAAFARLEHLLDHEPTNLTEITALGNVVNAYENTHGHQPLDPDSLIYRLEREMLTPGLTKKQFAELFEITPSRLNDMLYGKREVNLDLAKRLHRKLGIPAAFILAHA